jgi:hypothetical protein
MTCAVSITMSLRESPPSMSTRLDPWNCPFDSSAREKSAPRRVDDHVRQSHLWQLRTREDCAFDVRFLDLKVSPDGGLEFACQHRSPRRRIVLDAELGCGRRLDLPSR